MAWGTAGRLALAGYIGLLTIANAYAIGDEASQASAASQQSLGAQTRRRLRGLSQLAQPLTSRWQATTRRRLQGPSYKVHCFQQRYLHCKLKHHVYTCTHEYRKVCNRVTPSSVPTKPPVAPANKPTPKPTAKPTPKPKASPVSAPAKKPPPPRRSPPAQGDRTGEIVSWTNPVFNYNFPDPGVKQMNGKYYAFGTNGAKGNIQAAISSDMVHWYMQSDALPKLPSWAASGKTWAPEVTPVPGGYAVYFAAAAVGYGCQCIGVATSTKPGGPYTPVGSAPLICPTNLGGAIDPSPFTASDGTLWLVWKNDGNAIGLTTTIWLQQLTPNGVGLAGGALPMIHNDQAWEGPVVEAPFLWEQNGLFYLFYSANTYATASYAIGWAVAPALQGPYTKPGGPWLSSINTLANGNVIGPGGQNVVIGPDGGAWLTYHSADPSVAYLSRKLCLAPITWLPSGPSTALTWKVPENTQALYQG